MVDPGMRAVENPSFQYFVNSLGDAPGVGDYVDMLSWNDSTKQYAPRTVKVTARKIWVTPEPKDGRYASSDVLTIFVTLMVEKPSKADGIPDFRG